MVRLRSTKGFMLVEVCAAVIIMTMMTVLFLPCTELADVDEKCFPDAYLAQQSEAIAKSERNELDDADISLSFNEKGNVSRAMTIQKDQKTIVIELGGGRLVFK